MNKVIQIGNLTRDIELRYLPSGSAVATTGIATSRKFKKQDGSQGEEVCFIDITFFGRSAEIANQYLSKGKKIAVEGRLKLDSWTDNNGGKRSKHQIIVENMEMLGGKEQGGAVPTTVENTNQGYQPQNSPQQEYEQNPQQMTIDEDEIPF